MGNINEICVFKVLGINCEPKHLSGEY